ncbi:MAG: hypothetical protein K2M97_06900, partial [Muribaculaceae bacterium]|nr:hypothetical protein [Muribaculaceae bacterium]
MTKPIIFSILYATAMALTAPTVANAAATPQSRETVASALSQGRWVKFKVDANGIHEFTHDELVALGFSSPERVRVYGYPASALADHDPENSPAGMPEVASIHDACKLLF